ncbi:MAG TPA: hypothetical protein PKI19_07085 [Elusimicrobiales bacterium]|nr:hypothetical protein [Elusimicrobiales bacterium]
MNTEKRYPCPALFALLFFFPAGLYAADAPAPERSGLPGIKAGDIKAVKVPAPAAAPVKEAGASLAVLDNAPLLAEFTQAFGYKMNGQIRFPYKMADLRFYKLTGWSGYLLVQVDDHSLPSFHNFIVLKTAPGGGQDFKVQYRFDSQADESYTAATPAEKVCGLDPACADRNAQKKRGEASARAGLAAWEAFYFEPLKAALVKKAGDKFDSDKFAALGKDELRSAKARLGEILGKTAAGAGGKAAVLADLEAAWKVPLCGATSAELFERLKGASPAEQDKILLRCGLYQDTAWLIKQEYDDQLVRQLNGACLAGSGAAVNREYCETYRSWNEIYTRKTKMEERRLDGGRISL